MKRLLNLNLLLLGLGLGLVALQTPLVGAAPQKAGTATTEATTEGAEILVSGLDEAEAYSILPPVMVEVRGLDRSAKVWVVVRRAGGKESAAETVLADHRSILWTEDGGILNVEGLEKVSNKEGTWTLEIRTLDQVGNRTVTRTDFRISPQDLASN